MLNTDSLDSLFILVSLQSCYRQSGWRIRVLTRFGPNAGPTGREVKEAWALDDKTTIVIVDPSSPNILAFNTGEGVERLLSRSFFIELQSRYGNKFFVRDEVKSTLLSDSSTADVLLLQRSLTHLQRRCKRLRSCASMRAQATISQVKLHFPTNALRLSIMQLLCRQVFPLVSGACCCIGKNVTNDATLASRPNIHK